MFSQVKKIHFLVYNKYDDLEIIDKRISFDFKEDQNENL